MSDKSATPIGRFAPTPSGPLHFGSLVSAVASYCDIKSRGGHWLLRIEDLDTPRVVSGSSNDILNTLEVFGFAWDGEILYQSSRFEDYEQALQQLINDGQIYACNCSKKSLLRDAHKYGPLGLIYPGNCRSKSLPFKDTRLRLILDQEEISFNDRHYGPYSLNLQHQVGDISLKRNDGIYAYHLAVVIDDAFQQVTEIVRGADLLEVSCVHLYLNRLLDLPDAHYLHLPLVKNDDGIKLSKQTGAQALDIKKASQQLHAALTFLGQTTPNEIIQLTTTEILSYAVKHWDPSLIPTID